MRIVLPVHQGASRGIGTIVRGLCPSLPAGLAPEDELVLVGRRLQEAEQSKGSKVAAAPGSRRCG